VLVIIALLNMVALSIAAEPLKPVPDPAERRAAVGRLIGNQLERQIECPKPPPPVTGLSVESAYDPKDPTQSKIIKDRDAAYQQQVEVLRTFTRTISTMADQYIAIRPRDGRIAECLATWMDHWGRAGALLGPVSVQGNAERKWNLVAFSLAYALIADAPEIASPERARIEDWLKALARAWIAAPDWGRDRPNNHLNWGALALLSASVVTGDRDLFDHGIKLARRALDQIAPDGSLPLEMERGSRATLYHAYALEPLVIAAEIAAANGIDLYAERNGALHRLAKFVSRAVLDPQLVAKRAGEAQNRQDVASWGWALPYLARFPDEDLARTLRRFQTAPFENAWLGNMRLRFAGAAAARGQNDHRR
jgi:poly(beta-D-mannuronate) lyase